MSDVAQRSGDAFPTLPNRRVGQTHDHERRKYHRNIDFHRYGPTLDPGHLGASDLRQHELLPCGYPGYTGERTPGGGTSTLRCLRLWGGSMSERDR